MISRRFLLGTLVLVPVAGAAGIVLNDNARALVTKVISMHFGETIANSEAAQSFVTSWVQRLEDAGLKSTSLNVKAGFVAYTPARMVEAIARVDATEDWIVRDFCNETNVILHVERGDELEFSGKIDAYNAACWHPLSGNAL